MFDVRGQVIEEHDIEQHPENLCQRRFRVIGGFSLMFEALAADADTKYTLGAQTNHRTQGLLQPQATIAEVCGAFRGLESHRLEYQRNRRRRRDVISGDLRRQSDSAAPVPHGVALSALNE